MPPFKEYIDKNIAVVFWAGIALIVSAILLFLTQSIGEVQSWKFVGQGIEFRNTISVSGKGEVMVIPDTARFSFAVIEEAAEVTKAQEANTTKMNAILDALKDMDIPEKNIKTTSYSISPRYEYRETKNQDGFPVPGERVFAGYEVAHWIQVKMKNDESVGDALAQIGALGAMNISSIDFVVEDEDTVLRDARKKAITDAEEKARTLARDLDVRLVKIVSFSEGGGVPIFAKDFSLSTEAFGRGGAVEAQQIPSGENTITSYVTITYAIR